jgi:crotonobetainyl-CoA:carnitine CoA-transferase CaiB-like acyl-CoA transferase
VSAENLKPLSSVRVLDFTAMPPGGFCTVILDDLGAEVIRVRVTGAAEPKTRCANFPTQNPQDTDCPMLSALQRGM